MLVLSRREFESLIIGSNITITVLGWERGQVRIGIEAPREINVVREELLDRQEGQSFQDRFTKKSAT